MTDHVGAAMRPAYILTKMTATLFFQLVAQSMPVEKLQVVSFHPGLIYNDTWKSMGFGIEQFDKGKIQCPECLTLFF
jgi:hypothetical protein